MRTDTGDDNAVALQMSKSRDRQVAGAFSSDEALSARVCWYHYKEGLTQQETADRVGLSRATVNKIISEARTAGLVRIDVNSALSACLELESGLAKAYELDEVIVVPAPAHDRDAYYVVGQALGDYVSKRLGRNEILGLSWGTTIDFASNVLEPRNGMGNKVVSLCGGLPRSTAINPYDNASAFARRLDADCYYLTAPMTVESSAVRNAILSSESVKSVLEMAEKVDMAILTMVDLSPNSKILEHGVLTEELRQSLLDAGSVGNICDHYIDRNGALIDHPINDCTISAPLDLIDRLPKCVLAGGGTFKADILRASLRAGLCNVLITDERAADLLLRSAG